MYTLTVMSAVLAIFGTLTVYDALIVKRWSHFLAGGLTVALACAVMAVRVALFGW